MSKEARVSLKLNEVNAIVPGYVVILLLASTWSLDLSQDYW